MKILLLNYSPFFLLAITLPKLIFFHMSLYICVNISLGWSCVRWIVGSKGVLSDRLTLDFPKAFITILLSTVWKMLISPYSLTYS